MSPGETNQPKNPVERIPSCSELKRTGRLKNDGVVGGSICVSLSFSLVVNANFDRGFCQRRRRRLPRSIRKARPEIMLTPPYHGARGVARRASEGCCDRTNALRKPPNARLPYKRGSPVRRIFAVSMGLNGKLSGSPPPPVNGS